MAARCIKKTKKQKTSQSGKREQLLRVFVQPAHTPQFTPGAAATAAATLQTALSSAHERLIHPVLFH